LQAFIDMVLCNYFWWTQKTEK